MAVAVTKGLPKKKYRLTNAKVKLLPKMAHGQTILGADGKPLCYQLQTFTMELVQECTRNVFQALKRGRRGRIPASAQVRMT